MNLRQDLQAIQERALEAVNPGNAVARYMERIGQRLHIETQWWNLAEYDRVILLAVGKAAVPMAQKAVDILDLDQIEGCVVTKYGHAEGHTLPPSLLVYETGHPIPDASGIKASDHIITILQESAARDLVLLLLSGGGSALLPAPVLGLTLDHLQATTDALLRAGAIIDEVNAVRKHISALKGGQLARLASPSSLISLILSDVVGDPLDVIASGPTAPDPTSYATALSVIERYNIKESVPLAVIDHLQNGVMGYAVETPKPQDPVFSNVTNVIVGSNAMAVRAAIGEASARGYNTFLLSTYIDD